MSLEAVAKKLRATALSYPGSYEEQPWGERVVKVHGKIFFTCNVRDGELHASCKLPKSGKQALQRPYAQPTHYGMGKHGWVTFTLARDKDVPVEDLRAWMDESFRAIAPKRLVDGLGANGGAKNKAATATTAAKAKQAKALGRAIVVCGDALRAERAVKALAARGVACDVVAAPGKVKLGRARALVVDIGRNPGDGIALAKKIDGDDVEVHLFVAGVRDAEQARALRELGSAETFRAPPGDDAVADAVAAAVIGSRR